MKRFLIIFGFWYALFQFYGVFAPELVEAQGFGLRCDTPHCRYVPIYRGRFVGDGRHDYSPYGPYGYGGDYAPDYYPGARDGISIVNPAPGTNLSVKQESSGFFCGTWFSIGCGKKDVNFSTAAQKGYESIPPSYAQSAQQASVSKPESKSACATTCIRVSGGSSEASLIVKDELTKRSYSLTTNDKLDYELKISDGIVGDKISVKLELMDRNGKLVADSAGSARFRADGDDADAQRAATIIAAIDAMKKLKF